eukprot:COSAG05_NODE_204_length_14187_cov_99.887422_10_plen_106_part_00
MQRWIVWKIPEESYGKFQRKIIGATDLTRTWEQRSGIERTRAVVESERRQCLLLRSRQELGEPVRPAAPRVRLDMGVVGVVVPEFSPIGSQFPYILSHAMRSTEM